MTSLPIESPPPDATSADIALQRAEWQQVLFGERPRRLQLQALRATWPLRACRIRVHRNHGFELVASALEPYLQYAGLAPDIVIGSYDDSLAFDQGDPASLADVELLWLDYARYLGRVNPADIAHFVGGRVAALRALTDAPILVSDWGAVAPEFAESATLLNSALRAEVATVPGAHLCPQHEIARELGAAYEDLRAAAFTGSRLSDAANLATARALGTRWIPAVVLAPIKAVVLDLDGTCYAGVLGEDGAEAVELTHDHAALQRVAVALTSRGVFLAVVSRNERDDVEALFSDRSDFPLRREMLSAVHASWGAKADAIADVARALRIGTDAILFVDDNPGELAAVAAALPDVKLLHAGHDVARTTAALEQYPGVWRWAATREDSLRAADLAGSEARSHIARASGSPSEYLAALDVRLGFIVRPQGTQTRVHELSIKTNQFNLALSRWSEAEVSRRMERTDCAVVTVSLADRLSDSGVIALVSGHYEGGVMVVDELCVSCRALGRHLEDTIVARAVALIVREVQPHDAPPITDISFQWVRGPRNAPALDWLARFASASLDGDRGAVSVAWPDAPGWVRDRDLPISWVEQRAARTQPFATYSAPSA